MLNIFTILGLAVADSINPSAITVTIYLLTKKQFTRQVLAYISGIFCTYLTIGILLTTGLTSLLNISNNVLESDSAYWIQLALGLMMFIYAIIGKPFKVKDSTPRLDRTASSQRLSALFILGVGITIAEIATALPYMAAIGILAQTDTTLTVKILILVTYNIVMILPPLALLVIAQFGADRWEKRFNHLRNKIAMEAQETLYWVFGIVGFILVADSVNHFEWLH